MRKSHHDPVTGAPGVSRPSRTFAMRFRLPLFAALVLTTAALVAQRTAAPQAQNNAWADPAACATCHVDKALGFAKTGMGRSFYKLQPSNVVEALGRTFYHKASDSYFVMFERDGAYYQRRWQKDFNGQETNVDEKRVDFVMGSGNHGRTYLHISPQNTLQELPLGWYSEKGGYWSMAPGFDRPDYPGSTRVVTYECMYCHNAYPKIPAAHDDVGAKPQFLEPLPEGIECQRCHGPGQRHVEIAGTPGAKPEAIRASILNPKRLTPARELEVCMQCHLETTAVALPHDIRRFDRAPFSYLPGQPLGDFRLTFDRSGGMGERFEVAHAAYRMRESQCFLKTESTARPLRCTTCHDPHNIPRGEDATAHYNAICRDCHAAVAKLNTAPHTAAANCISCHMPKRRTEDAVYMLMTDHLIRRRQPAGDLLAPRQETHDTPATAYRGPVVPYYPAELASTSTPPARKAEESQLYLALAQVIESSNLREGIPQLQSLLERYKPTRPEFYADLAEAWSAVGQPARALPWFEEAVRHAPDSAIMLRKLGSAQMDANQLKQAESTLLHATSVNPEDGGAWGMLGQVLWRQQRNPEAHAAFAKALAADPEVADLHASLATMLFSENDAAGAEKEFRESLRIQPNSATVQANLGSLLASRGESEQARFHFERSLALNPDLAEAHLNYARLLFTLGDAEAATRHAQTASHSDSAAIAGAARQLLQMIGR